MRTLDDLTEQMHRSRSASAFLEYMKFKALRRPMDELPDSPPFAKIKAAVAALSTNNTAALRATSLDLIRLVNAKTILGQMQGSWLPAPPYTKLITVPNDPIGTFIAPAAPIPAVAFSVTSAMTDTAMIGAIYGLSAELLRMADPRSQGLFERAMVAAMRLTEDSEFLSTTAAITGTRPAGILLGAPEFSGGGSPSGIEDGLQQMFAYVSDGGAGAPFLIMSARTALYLATQRVEGSAFFPDVTINGGSIAGIPVVISRVAGNVIVLLDASKLGVVDDGLIVESSTASAIQAVGNPAAAAADLISAWQTNSAWIKVLRYLSWTLATDDAVAFMTLSELATSPS